MPVLRECSLVMRNSSLMTVAVPEDTARVKAPVTNGQAGTDDLARRPRRQIMNDKYCAKDYKDIYIMHVTQKNVRTRTPAEPCRQS